MFFALTSSFSMSRTTIRFWCFVSVGPVVLRSFLEVKVHEEVRKWMIMSWSLRGDSGWRLVFQGLLRRHRKGWGYHAIPSLPPHPPPCPSLLHGALTHHNKFAYITRQSAQLKACTPSLCLRLSLCFSPCKKPVEAPGHYNRPPPSLSLPFRISIWTERWEGVSC